jgi:mycothiol synthase
VPDIDVRTFLRADASALREIALTALADGDLAGLTVQDIEDWHDRLPADPERTLVAVENDRVAGFFNPDYPLLIVARDRRRQRHGTRLVERALARAETAGEPRLYLAPPVGNAASAAFATSLGFAYRSSLWQLRLPITVPTPPIEFPATVTTRTFHASDLAAYVRLINAAFADHPSPIRVTEQSVRHVHGLAGFDPSHILLVAPFERPDAPIAFCRTVATFAAGITAGDVALIGVLPEWQGRGIGRALLIWGIDHLRALAAADITLTVEARNQPALRLYERTGFVPVQEWPRWAKELPAEPPLPPL